MALSESDVKSSNSEHQIKQLFSKWKPVLIRKLCTNQPKKYNHALVSYSRFLPLPPDTDTFFKIGISCLEHFWALLLKSHRTMKGIHSSRSQQCRQSVPGPAELLKNDTYTTGVCPLWSIVRSVSGGRTQVDPIVKKPSTVGNGGWTEWRQPIDLIIKSLHHHGTTI